MPFPAVPVAIGAGVLGLGAIGLRLRALSLAKKPATAAIPGAPPAAVNLPKASPPPTPAPQSPFILPPGDPLTVEFVEALPKLINNPDGTPHIPGTAFTSSTTAEAQEVVAEANRRHISVAQLLLERSGQLSPSKSGDGIAALGQKAIVTTNDPAPSGDLIIRSAPSQSAAQVGGAEKNGTVIVLDSSDPVFARIAWPGGNRWPAATGFAKKAFLKLV